ncbi:MAG: VOC family protein [Proteobacteria bacterium]|nr:VOC family protein [Pseudomonadota bacterium]
MSDQVKPIPDGYHTATPYLLVDDADSAIDFYTKAFGAEELYRMPGPNNRVMHAEIRIGNSIVMLADEFPEMGGNCKSPATLGGCSASLLIYTEDTDSAFRRALDAGAKALMEPADMFWGRRFAMVTDPFGHDWQFATQVEDVSPEQMAERFKQACSS